MHPDLETLLRFNAEALSVEGTSDIDAHLAVCPTCLDRARALRSLQRDFDTARDTWTLAELKREAEQHGLASLGPGASASSGRTAPALQGNPPVPGRGTPSKGSASVERPLSRPESGGSPFAVFRLLADLLRELAARPAWAAGCAVLLGLVIIWLWPHGQERSVARLSDATGVITVTEKGALVLPTELGLPAWCKTRVAEMVSSGRVAPAPQMAEVLNRLQSPSALLSAPTDQTNRPVLLSPVSGSVRTPLPRFHWQGVAGATDYRVVVAGPEGVLAELEAGTATNAAWSLKEPTLSAGQVYAWQVEADVRGKLRSSPPAHFYVLAASELAELERLEQQQHSSAAVLTALYQAWGLFDEANLQWQELLRLNPDNPVVRRIGEGLAARLRGEAPPSNHEPKPE
jgi:hypothetical protein